LPFSNTRGLPMLRIAIYYDNRVSGRNDGNPLYVWNCLKKKQEKGELEVDHLAPTGDLSLHGKYDAHIWVDWGEDGLAQMGLIPYKMIYPTKNGKDPIVYWTNDTHLGDATLKYRLQLAKLSDIVLMGQKPNIPAFEAEGVNPTWFPCGVEPQAYPRITRASQHYDLCFVGHINGEKRIDALDKMFREFPSFFFGQRLFEDAAAIFSDAKICFNIAVSNDINMRNFEVMGAGGFLLTERVPHLEELFTDGVHCVMYDTIDEAVEKAKYYLAHDEERIKIANAGYEEVLKKHTIEHRVDAILEKIKQFKEASCLV
jgi:hypothetical protein